MANQTQKIPLPPPPPPFLFLEQCEDKLNSRGHRKNAAGSGGGTGGGGDRLGGQEASLYGEHILRRTHSCRYCGLGGQEASLAIEQALASELQAIQSAIAQVSFDTIIGLF